MSSLDSLNFEVRFILSERLGKMRFYHNFIGLFYFKLLIQLIQSKTGSSNLLRLRVSGERPKAFDFFCDDSNEL